MRTLILALLLFSASLGMGADYPKELPTVLEYIHVIEQGQSLSENLPWNLSGKDEKVWISEWKASYTMPTADYCTGKVSLAVAWKANKDKEQKSDFDGWDNASLKALCKVLLDEINILRVKAGLSERTSAQLKAALKAKMD